VPIVIGIIAGLFLLQNFGTQIVGKAFGPIMLVWFAMLAVLGGGLDCAEPRHSPSLQPLLRL
jgi:KUP system potassium uptake protein